MWQCLILYIFNSLKLHLLPFSSVKVSCTQNYPALNSVRPVFIQKLYKQNPSQEVVEASYHYLEMFIEMACQFSLLESAPISHLFWQEHRKKQRVLRKNTTILLWDMNYGRVILASRFAGFFLNGWMWSWFYWDCYHWDFILCILSVENQTHLNVIGLQFSYWMLIPTQ